MSRKSRRPKSALKGSATNIVAEIIEAARQRRGDARQASDERLLGLTAFARDMDVSVHAVQKWYSQNRIPSERVLRAEEVSGVPRHRIRPDLYPPEREIHTSPPAASALV